MLCKEKYLYLESVFGILLYLSNVVVPLYNLDKIKNDRLSLLADRTYRIIVINGLFKLVIYENG